MDVTENVLAQKMGEQELKINQSTKEDTAISQLPLDFLDSQDTRNADFVTDDHGDLTTDQEKRQIIELNETNRSIDPMKPKIKKYRFNFELRETTPLNSDSDTDDLDPENDGLPDPAMNQPPIEIKVYEEDDNGN